MTTSAFTQKYRVFTKLLVETRKSNKTTQKSLAEKLGKPQSFISKYESGERRLDLIEFLDIARALSIDPYAFINQLEKKMDSFES